MTDIGEVDSSRSLRQLGEVHRGLKDVGTKGIFINWCFLRHKYQGVCSMQ